MRSDVIRTQRTLQLMTENAPAEGVAMNHKERYLALTALLNRQRAVRNLDSVLTRRNGFLLLTLDDLHLALHRLSVRTPCSVSRESPYSRAIFWVVQDGAHQAATLCTSGTYYRNGFPRRHVIFLLLCGIAQNLVEFDHREEP
jgi:hypothetical protein